MKILLTILSLAILQSSFATNYYIKNTGNDANTGTSDAQAWQTLTKLNGFSFSPGDNILFKRDDTWRGLLTVSSAGTFGSPITLASYGLGASPRILGSELATSWTNKGSNVWEASGTFSNPDTGDPYPGTVYFTTATDTTFGHVQKANTAGLVTQYDWCWVANKISVYSTADPSTIYSQVEVTQRKDGIRLNNKNYLQIDGLTVQFCGNNGITGGDNTGKKGLLIQNCVVSFIGVKGGGSAFGMQPNYSDMTVQDNYINATGRRGFSIGNILDNDTIRNVTLQRNELKNGYHTTGFDIAVGTYNSVIEKLRILNNYIHDSADKKVTGSENYSSILIFISNKATGGGYIDSVTISGNRFGFPSATAIQLETTTRVAISGNTFMGTNSSLAGIGGIGVGWGDGATGTTIRNNIFYGNSYATNQAVGVFMGSVDPSLNMDYNIYYQQDATKNIIYNFNTATGYKVSDFSTFRSATGQESHGKTGDPLLNSDFTLRTGSPAIGSGEGGINMGASQNIPPVVIIGAPWPLPIKIRLVNAN